MFTQKKLNGFCRLTLKYGVNLQKGQGLYVACPVELKDVAEEFCRTGYDMGAKNCIVHWEDEIIDAINYKNADLKTLTDIPSWVIKSKEYVVNENYCYVAIASEDPNAFKGIPAEKISATMKVRGKLLKKYSDAIMTNKIRWCVVSLPTKAWAKQVFPSSENPEKDLYSAIIKSMRLDSPDPIKSWEEHVSLLNKRATKLNGFNFDYLHFKSKNGTDLRVYLAKNHVWLSAQEKASDGINFIANMPTEEVFTCPDANKTEGTVVSALPLNYNGNIIDNFSIRFEKGKIVSYSAKKGYDILKGLIDTDEGTKRIGEVALIGKNSPIKKQNVLFYNTLFDENASCHLAIGKAYPTTIKNGNKMKKSKLRKMGANDSIEHVDFMIGTDDLIVEGVKGNEKITVFNDGEWSI